MPPRFGSRGRSSGSGRGTGRGPGSRGGERSWPNRGDWSDWGYPPSHPIPVEGGLRAKSQRGAIGETWWSRRFIEVLEQFNQPARLTRGRTYARAGQVLDIEVQAGAVSARVQGSRPTPYRCGSA